MTHGIDGNIRQSDTVHPASVDWSVLSPQGHVLFFIALCPDSSAKDIARAIGHTERQIWNIIQDLKKGGMLHISKNGRRQVFRINLDARFLHPTIEGLSLRSVMEGAVDQVRSRTPGICEEVCA